MKINKNRGRSRVTAYVKKGPIVVNLFKFVKLSVSCMRLVKNKVDSNPTCYANSVFLII